MTGAVRVLGALTLLCLLVHAYLKGSGLLGEMLWPCHAATLLIGMGALMARPRWLSAGFLFHCAMGFPGYLLDALHTHSTTWSSVVVHVLPLVVGVLALHRRGLSPGVLLPTWLLYLALVVLSYFFTDPKLNVNLAHAPWPPLARFFPRLIALWIFNAALSLIFLFCGDKLLRALFGSAPPLSAASPVESR